MDASTPTPNRQTLQLRTADGFVLAATFYPAIKARAVSVLLCSATGVPRRYYDAFAQHLAGCGLSVLTFDYRGIGDSRAAKGTIEDWGRYDLVAALGRLAELCPNDALTLVGHSIGGQILGLAQNIDRVRAAVLVAAQSGYWRHWPWPRKARMWLLWWVLMPGLTRLLGWFPGRWVGTADLPAPIARSWARWGRNPHYICDDDGNALRPFNNLVTFPIRWISFTDDIVAPFKAVEALRTYYPLAPQERLHLSPRELSCDTIGHFGYFRKTTPRGNWDCIADWLVNARELSMSDGRCHRIGGELAPTRSE